MVYDNDLLNAMLNENFMTYELNIFPGMWKYNVKLFIAFFICSTQVVEIEEAKKPLITQCK